MAEYSNSHRYDLYCSQKISDKARKNEGGKVQFDTKIAVVVRQDLAVWQKLNVTAFTISGIAGNSRCDGRRLR